MNLNSKAFISYGRTIHLRKCHFLGRKGSKTGQICRFLEELNALSFYRSQNVLGWSKFFVPDQKFIYILWQSQTFCARQKDDLHSVKLVFVPAQKFLKRNKTFWDLKKRTRRYCLICILCLQGIKKGSASIFADDALTLMMTPKRPKIY